MRIDDAVRITALPPSPPKPAERSAAAASALTDTLEISDAAYQKVEQLQQGTAALQQAIIQSRQSARAAAQERVASAREYLKILSRMSLPGDRGAAAEAARMAREIKSATAEFRSTIASGEETGESNRSEIAGFAGVAGDALKIANGLVLSYLHKRKSGQPGDSDMEKQISGALAGVRDMVMSAMAPS